MNTTSTEDYIKNIFDLESSFGYAATNLLAEKLKIAPPSVTEMIKKLANQKLISYKPYKGVTLTKKGNIIALKIIRKHRLWEMFLLEVLKFNWDEIHDEADNFEHIMTEKMEKKVDEFLGFPKFDPHGAPIPTAKGIMPKIKTIPLLNATLGSKLKIVRVYDEESELLKFISSIGLTIGKQFFLIDKLKFDNSLKIKIAGKEQIISSTLANNIFVEVL